MKTFAILAAVAIALVLAPQLSRASVVLLEIDISPMTGAANLGATTYVRDHAAGLSGLNENGMFAVSGSGNEIGGGITYDDVTNNLAFDFAYGSAFGFADLAGDFTLIHFHGAGPVNFPAANTSAGIQVNLAGFHTASGTRSGRITGAQILSVAQETMLFDNNLYINIHSGAQGGGEIRGQLVIVPEPGSILLAGVAGCLFVLRRRR